jgi:hypothetical protein
MPSEIAKTKGLNVFEESLVWRDADTQIDWSDGESSDGDSHL